MNETSSTAPPSVGPPPNWVRRFRVTPAGAVSLMHAFGGAGGARRTPRYRGQRRKVLRDYRERRWLEVGGVRALRLGGQPDLAREIAGDREVAGVADAVATE